MSFAGARESLGIFQAQRRINLACALGFLFTGIMAAAAGPSPTPGQVAAGGPAAAAHDRLATIRALVSDRLAQQVNCTCQQSIVRYQRDSRSDPFQPLDTLRLEVALIGDREMFSWPAANGFDTENIRKLIPAGSTSSASFASHARNVFLSEEAVYSYAGREALPGGACFRYDYTVPVESSNYVLKTRGHSGVVAARGSFWVDAKTLDVVRLEVNAGEIPQNLGLESVREVMEYARMRIGDREFLLPATAQTSAVLSNGKAVRIEMRLSDCRQYVTESVISFDAQPAVVSEPDPAPVTPAVVRLPANVRLELELETPIDEESSKVGDRVSAVVRADVRWKSNVIVPKGAVASGRIIRLEKMPGEEDAHIVALQFETLEFDNKRVDLAAELVAFHTWVGAGLDASVAFDEQESWIRTRERRGTLPTVGVVRIHTETAHLYVPRGTVLAWKTLPRK